MLYDMRPAYDMTLSEALSDPLIQSVMVADGVDRNGLELMLEKVTSSLKFRRTNGPTARQSHKRHSASRLSQCSVLVACSALSQCYSTPMRTLLRHSMACSSVHEYYGEGVLFARR